MPAMNAKKRTARIIRPRSAPLSMGHDPFLIRFEPADHIGRDLLQAVPDSLKQRHILREGGYEIGSGMSLSPQFLNIFPVGLERGDCKTALFSQMREAGQVERAKGEAEISLLHPLAPQDKPSVRGEQIRRHVFRRKINLLGKYLGHFRRLGPDVFAPPPHFPECHRQNKSNDEEKRIKKVRDRPEPAEFPPFVTRIDPKPAEKVLQDPVDPL